MAILGYQTNFSRMNLETFQNFALFRYFLIPFAIFLTVVPTGIFSLIQQYQQNQSVLTYTTIISQEDNTANGDNSGAGIVLTPNRLTLSGDFICVTCAWIITWIGICGFLRKNNLIGQFISAFLIAFTVLQTLSAIYTVIFSDQWILEILSGSWKKAYLFDSEIIKESQCEFSCKEFVSADDGQKNMPYQPSQFDGCSKTLMNRFGTQLFDVAKIMLLARFVQLFGVLLHIHIFNRVILDDMKTMYAEEYDSEYYYDDKEYYNDDYISSDELEFEEFEEFEDDDDQYDQYEYDDQYDDQDSWIDSPTSSLLLSKIYFGEQQTS